MIDWNIQTRAQACQGCGQAFADKQAFHTALFDEKSGYVRQDLCERCWSERAGATSANRGFVSHWQTVFEIPPAQPELIRKETAEDLLRQLLALDDPRHGAAVYILAVMLERKRLLKVKDQIQRDGRRCFVYEHPRSGDVFTILDPQLSLDQLDQVQHDVSQLLEHGLKAPPPAPAAAAPESP